MVCSIKWKTGLTHVVSGGICLSSVLGGTVMLVGVRYNRNGRYSQPQPLFFIARKILYSFYEFDSDFEGGSGYGEE